MAGDTPIQVRSATEDDIPRMTELLGQTFQDGDAVGEFMFPDGRQREVRQQRMFAAMLKHRFIPAGGADVAVAGDGHIVGVVMWSPTWGKHSVFRMIRENLALLRAMRSRVTAGLAVEAATARGRPKEPHIYVMYLGVDKGWFGRGAAQALMDRLRTAADSQAAGLFGTCQRKLLPFYRDVFPDGAIVGNTTLGRNGPAFYFIYREPVRRR